MAACVKLQLRGVVVVCGPCRANDRQIVYYWFNQGGYEETNEYKARLRLFSNLLVSQRSDGALIRFVAPVDSARGEAGADRAIQQFMSKIGPALSGYLP